jgi:hypothetical protein
MACERLKLEEEECSAKVFSLENHWGYVMLLVFVSIKLFGGDNPNGVQSAIFS